MDYNLRWTEESVRNLDEIIKDIRKKWSEKEVDNFRSMLKSKIEFILNNPFLYQASDYFPKMRKAVLNKKTTIFYQVDKDSIIIAYLHINKKDLNKLN
ncbi:MAG: type II toxin-antitoxin system RelE/ParE family toxin [Bacteroidetes bacterium]|jgi:plasmid stabilization system protein ParE|nr:MAG: type II toxin-antitoxin system RelE/ParE family toxin [Bacteroidota bacterium]|tara:strand:+ start:225 stop:518 length:294 start_codon:yes stop_codon:yes gene_type:complete